MKAERIAFTEDRNKIISLWSEVFGDSSEEIEYFLENCKHKKCLGLFANGALVSMLFLVDCKYTSLYGKYIYAVCTKREFRGKGYAGALIDYAKSLDYDFLWLIPANDGLFDYYLNFGFETKLFSRGKFADSVEFDETEDIVSYLYEGSDYAFPKGMVYSKTDFPPGSTGLKK